MGKIAAFGFQDGEKMGLSLQALYAAWDDREGDFEWKWTADENAAVINLPFGLLRLEIIPEDGDSTHVFFSLYLTRSVRLHALEIKYLTAFSEPDQVWVPHLCPGQDLIIADEIFRSPVLMAEKGGVAVALVPDVAAWPDGIQSYLNITRHRADGRVELIHALGSWTTSGHTFFKKIKARSKLPVGTELRSAHYVLQWQDAKDTALERAASFLWNRFARQDGVAPQVLPFARYEELIQDRIFAPDLYRTFQYQGRSVAAMITQTTTSKKKPKVRNEKGVKSFLADQERYMQLFRFLTSYAVAYPASTKLLSRILHSGLVDILPMAWFQAWLNQVRTSFGAALHAQRTGNRDLAAKADAILELALSAPMENGLPWAICMFPEDGVVFWKRGSRGFEIIDTFHLPDAAITGYHLLEWHEWIKPDPRILPRCVSIADVFVELQDASGAIPIWINPDGPRFTIEERLSRSASTAAPAMLLAKLYQLTREPKYRAAAEKAVRFVEREALPANKWFDFETFYSCVTKFRNSEEPDPFTGCYPANTLCMYWSTRAALDLYSVTQDPAMLNFARQCLARLSLYQQVFDHPRLSIDTFGGFGVMNMDGEFNDARQGLFVQLYLDMYRVTGEPEMFERGLAALRASFTTMLVEEHYQVAPGNLVNFRPSDRGSILENYAHNGRDEVTGGYLSPDWGCATAWYASGLTFRKFGQVYLDPKNARAFGIDRCRARFMSMKRRAVEIEVTGEGLGPLEIVMEDPERRVEKLTVNGRAAKLIDAARRRFLID